MAKTHNNQFNIKRIIFKKSFFYCLIKKYTFDKMLQNVAKINSRGLRENEITS